VESEATVPRIVWTAWLQGYDAAPEVVRRCLESWQANNPGWEVRALSEDDMGEVTSFDHLAGPLRRQSLNHRSDMLRLDLLATHGGVWADATCLCMRPLDDWIDARTASSGFFAFHRPGPDRLISTWFLAARRQQPLLTALRDFMRTHWDRPYWSEPERLARFLSRSARRRRLWFTPPVRDWLRADVYFAFHYAFELLVERDPAHAATWAATPKVPVDPSHRLFSLGFLSAVTEAVLAEIAETPPVYKLTWRYDLDAPIEGTVLEHVYRLAGVGSPAQPRGRLAP
jgi:hypothetical protein